jgi:hypothetical protein
MFKMTTTSTNTLLTTALKRATTCIVAGGEAAQTVLFSFLWSCSVVGFVAYTLCFRVPHRQKCRGVKSGNWVDTPVSLFILSIFWGNEHRDRFSD